jgi:hypothetical protein
MGETSRIKLFKDFRSDAKKNDVLSEFDKKYRDFSSWESINFANNDSVKSVWNKSLKDILNPVSLSDFYQKFACDLAWAKTTNYCSSQQTPKQTTADWSSYPCVVSLANSKGVKIQSNGAYLIDNFRYFANGRKGDLTTGKVLDYTCNDPEFKTQQTPDKTQKSNTQLKYRECPEVHPVEFGCKNNLVKTFQKCLGVNDDGKFGPITRQKMEDLGLRGDVITAKERIAVCSRLDPVTPETQNLGYEDYTNDEYEDSSEKPEQEFSTGYEDYTLEEN